MPIEEKESCKACDGKGYLVAPDSYADECVYCKGTGAVFVKSVEKKKSTTNLLDKVNFGNPKETSLETTNVLTYELGDLVKNLFYRKIYPEREKFHTIEAKTAMSDLLTQCQILCDREGWDFKNLHKMGISRLIERIDRRMELRE